MVYIIYLQAIYYISYCIVVMDSHSPPLSPGISENRKYFNDYPFYSFVSVCSPKILIIHKRLKIIGYQRSQKVSELCLARI